MQPLASRSSLTANANALGIFAGFDRPMDGNHTLKLSHTRANSAKQPRTRPDTEMVALAKQLTDRQTTTYDPSDLEDRYEKRLRAMIDAKLKGEGIDVSEPPTHTFEGCPPLDLICVPGGYRGVIQAMEDRDLIEFVRRQARTAKYVTSVCTGAFILGAARLLKGRRASTHWGFADLLPLVGALHEKRRVVWEGNLITAGGVTSGIDFGLEVVADIAGEAVARSIQLSLEYDPNPPFVSRSRHSGDALMPIGYPVGKYGPLARRSVSEVTYSEHWGGPCRASHLPEDCAE
jgi:hypothetical protein